MSAAIREAIAAELDEARAAAEKALGRVQQLEELDAQAAQLDGEAPVAAPYASIGANPPAVPPASPAPARKGGRPSKAESVEDLLPAVRRTLRELSPTTPNAIARELGIANGGQTYQNVRTAVLELVKRGEACEQGNVRGRPAYALSNGGPPERTPEPAIPAGTRLPSGVRVEPTASNPIDVMVARIEAALHLNGSRERDDLKDRVAEDGKGDVYAEDFRLALDRAITLNRVRRFERGGLIVYGANVR